MTSEQSGRFFGIFYNSRFQEIIALDLARKAGRLEKIVLWVLLISIAASLLTGSLSFLKISELAPLWAIISISAILVSIYSLAQAPGERRFVHYDTVRAFQSLSLECENFTGYAVHNTIQEENINETATKLHRKYAALIDILSIEHREHGNKNAASLTKQLDDILRAEGFIEAEPEEQPEPDEQQGSAEHQQEGEEKPK